MRRAAGFTLIELLVTMLIGGIILLALLGLVDASQSLYRTDTARAAVNQDVSVALTALTNDTREAGERMPRDVPALEVTGAADARVLTVRRNLVDVVLPVCKDLKAGSSADVVFVSSPGNSPGKKLPASCKSSSSEINFDVWKQYRLDQGGTVRVYVFNPKTGGGESFIYDREDNSGQHLHRASGKWQRDYPTEDEPRVYIIEERVYARDAATNTLTLAQDGGCPPA